MQNSKSQDHGRRFLTLIVTVSTHIDERHNNKQTTRSRVETTVQQCPLVLFQTMFTVAQFLSGISPLQNKQIADHSQCLCDPLTVLATPRLIFVGCQCAFCGVYCSADKTDHFLFFSLYWQISQVLFLFITLPSIQIHLRRVHTGRKKNFPR